MAPSAPITLAPRKNPRQARSQTTVDAIFEAAIQVLLSDGLPRLTTIRVAERAGVSVGTLYQYYPHKQALLYAVLERHLVRVRDAVTQAAASSHHKPLAKMVSAVVDALVKVKTGRIEESRALYGVFAELNSRKVLREHEQHCRSALVAMLKTAKDAKFRDLEKVVFVLATAMSGPTRAVVEGNGPPKMVNALRRHLRALCLGYLGRENAIKQKRIT